MTATLIAFPGGRSRTVGEWEAAAELAAADAIDRFLGSNPCPVPGLSQVAIDLAEWAARLRSDAGARRAEAR
ncbi:hypothetical protein DSM104299_01006 [Baekduia alba]|uniref:hypothetical protein n=1 Tax=Baekduia alba TaxID=2997333 RepID=UPI0023419A16|nr:hypothetical protein [Baekduia alba]WCB92311.1 hypothetical protein DSM104299_01001 [Baekduia alba]WCB92316.1 hypothetical protein DSM104299_01006 [Baekduia alba]